MCFLPFEELSTETQVCLVKFKHFKIFNILTKFWRPNFSMKWNIRGWWYFLTYQRCILSFRPPKNLLSINILYIVKYEIVSFNEKLVKILLFSLKSIFDIFKKYWLRGWAEVFGNDCFHTVITRNITDCSRPDWNLGRSGICPGISGICLDQIRILVWSRPN